MVGKFDTGHWHSTIGQIIEAESADTIAAALADLIGQTVPHEGTCLLAFHRNARPDVLHHTLEPASRKHYLERYLAGPYLLDPLYQLALQSRKPSLCRFRDELPDRFRLSEYYRQYCEQTHLLDEMDYLFSVDENTTLVLVVGRQRRMFTKAEVQRLKLIEPTVQACISQVWRYSGSRPPRQERSDTVHERLIDCFEKFGESVLTERERQISQLLLRGHSTKSIARVLRIAPGTVMVHKRNLFAKLDISSQYELFSLFISQLGSG